MAAALASALACGSSAPAGGATLRVPVGDSPQRGPSDAWVTVVEFADFQCPYCRNEEPIVADLVAAYGSDLRVVYKHLLAPPSVHPHAQAAAVAAECAHDQGKFWELHDLLFTTALDEATLVADAQQVPGLDLAAWQACREAAAPPAQLAADAALAARMRVNATPTFAVNGVRQVGTWPDAAALRAAVEQARAAAIASGIPRAEYYGRAVLGP